MLLRYLSTTEYMGNCNSSLGGHEMRYVICFLLCIGANSSVLALGSVGDAGPVLVPTYQSIHDGVFMQKCLKCHAPGQQAQDVPLEPFAKIMEDGSTIVPGNLDKSAIVAVIQKGSMPPPKSLIPAVTPEEFAAIKIWITNGAKP